MPLLKGLAKFTPGNDPSADISDLRISSDKLYAATEDGKIKILTLDLTLVEEIDAHSSSIFTLAIDEQKGLIYSGSNEGTIKAFNSKTLKNEFTLNEDNTNPVRRLRINNGLLYSVDEAGDVILWKDNKPEEKYALHQEIWDFLVIENNHLMSASDREVNFNEMIKGTDTKPCRLINKGNYSGRSPLCLVKDKWLCSVDRGGTCIEVREKEGSKLKQTGLLKGHHMIVNALSTDGTNIYSGGWDTLVYKWDIQSLKKLGSSGDDNGGSFNTITAMPNGVVFAGGENGTIWKYQ